MSTKRPESPASLWLYYQGTTMSQEKIAISDQFYLPKIGIDTHAHLDLDNLLTDLSNVVIRAQKVGVEMIGNVFLGPEAYIKSHSLFYSYDQIFFILGIHPHEAKNATAESIEKMMQCFNNDSKIKALGEIGLDYYRNRSPRKDQLSIFKDQLKLARDRDLSVVIHSRAAEKETLKILLDMGFKDRPLLWHCFSKDYDFACELRQKGWLISIPGIVTYNKAELLQETVKQLSLKDFVLETDCPFLTPEPYRGIRNEPALTVFTAHKVAELLQEDVLRVWQHSSENARHFFKLPQIDL